jgi:hypothetical protein
MRSKPGPPMTLQNMRQDGVRGTPDFRPHEEP